jgi:hypothetical protein
VCAAKCVELIEADGLAVPDGDVEAYCVANARPSTNFGTDGCYAGFCTTGGSPHPDPVDPRRDPEPVTWVDLQNTEPAGNTLAFNGPDPMTGLFSAGAASYQLITTGDAWVEFAAGENDVSHAVGLRVSCDDVALCPDEDPTLEGLPLLLSLNVDNNVNIVLNGSVIAGPFPAYTPGERFRIHVRDVHSGNGAVELLFFRYATPCVPNMACSDPPFFTFGNGDLLHYPLRVDAIFREVGATLQDVTIMRIK